MIRTRRGTRRRETDTAGSSPILLLAHSLYSNDTSGVLLLLLQQVNGVVNGVFERVCGRPLYSSKGRFPPSTIMETLTTAFWRIRTMFSPKLRVRPFHVGSADPLWPPLATVFVWYTAWWVLMSDGRCRGLVGRFGLVCGPSLLV